MWFANIRIFIQCFFYPNQNVWIFIQIDNICYIIHFLCECLTCVIAPSLKVDPIYYVILLPP